MTLELIETFRRDGSIRARIVGLPAGHSCEIRPITPESSRYQFVTCNGSVHGRRYNGYSTYSDIVERAMRWAERKVKEAS